jgi:hypothetical protein
MAPILHAASSPRVLASRSLPHPVEPLHASPRPASLCHPRRGESTTAEASRSRSSSSSSSSRSRHVRRRRALSSIRRRGDVSREEGANPEGVACRSSGYSGYSGYTHCKCIGFGSRSQRSCSSQGQHLRLLFSRRNRIHRRSVVAAAQAQGSGQSGQSRLAEANLSSSERNLTLSLSLSLS